MTPRGPWPVARMIVAAFFLITGHWTLATGHAETGYLADQAELAWQERDNPGQTEKAIQLWHQAVKAEPQRGDLWTKLTRAAGRAVRHATTKADRQQWAEAALGYGREATQRSPQSSDAFAAYGEALGQWANQNKGLHSLKTVKQAIEALKTAVTLNPKNHYAHMLLSSFYREAPSVISVGNSTLALEEARLAVLHGPAYAINHLVLAKSLLETGKKDQAIAELQAVLQLPPPADAIPETRSDHDSARLLLKSLGVTPHTEMLPAASPCQEGNACSAPGHP